MRFSLGEHLFAVISKSFTKDLSKDGMILLIKLS